MFHDIVGILIGFIIAPFIMVAMGVILLVGCLDEIGEFLKDKIELIG